MAGRVERRGRDYFATRLGARLRVRRHRPPAASYRGRAIAITELLLDSPPE
jgi:hypothetical protein